MIIDDDPRMLRLLKRTLLPFRNPPLHIMEACGGQEGLEILRSQKPDVILLDLAMPEISGYDILKELEAEPLYHDTSVILMTGIELKEQDFLIHELSIYNSSGFPVSSALKSINFLVKELSKVRKSQ